jgi:hypothetical protein
VTDPPEARYFAGEMLCGVFRVEKALARQPDRQSIANVLAARCNTVAHGNQDACDSMWFEAP